MQALEQGGGRKREGKWGKRSVQHLNPPKSMLTTDEIHKYEKNPASEQPIQQHPNIQNITFSKSPIPSAITIIPNTMPTKGTVLVTGANGYIAARTVEAFLKAGYSVRGTVRSLSSATEVKQALAEYADNLEFVEVPDITLAGAFDDAVKGEFTFLNNKPIYLMRKPNIKLGVDAIGHLASPVSFQFTDPEPVLHSAINGTVRVLESALKEPRIKNFVLMSSVTAIMEPKTEDYTFTEADWNTAAENAVAEQGKETPGRVIYAASKVAAERAMWKFRDEQKPNFTLTTINPWSVMLPQHNCRVTDSG